MDKNSSAETSMKIKDILESVSDAKERLKQRLGDIENDLQETYQKKIEKLKKDFDRDSQNEETEYNAKKTQLSSNGADASRFEELERQHTNTLNSLNKNLDNEIRKIEDSALGKIVEAVSGTDSRIKKEDITFSDLNYVLHLIESELKVSTAKECLGEWQKNVNEIVSKMDNGSLDVSAKTVNEIANLIKERDKAQQKFAEGIAVAAGSIEKTDEAFNTALEGILDNFKDGIESEERANDDLLELIAKNHAISEKNILALKESHKATSNAAANLDVDAELKKKLIDVLKVKYQGQNLDASRLNELASAYINHAKGRKNFSAADGKTLSSYSKFQKVRDKYISKDTAGSRLFKLVLAGAKAGKGKRMSAMFGSIKQDIRKDYDSFFYKDAESVGGVLRSGIGAFLESFLSSNRKSRQAEKELAEYDKKGKETITSILAGKSSPSLGMGDTGSSANVTTGKISGYASGKRNIEDGMHVVGEKGAELLFKQGNSVSIMQIKPDASSPASIGIAPKTQEKPAMESGAEFERKQQETNDRHAISKNVETIVELLREGNELAKKNKEEKKEGGGLFGLLGALAGTVLPKLLNAFNALKRALNFARAGLKALGKLPGMLMSKFGGLGKFLSSIFGKGGKLAGIFSKVGNFFSSIFGKGGKLAGIFSKIGGIFSKGGFIGKLVKGFGSIFKIFGPVIKTIAPFFKVLGKLFLPLRVLFTALDVFKGWTDKDMHRQMFNLKDGQEATAGQKYQATLSSVFSGLTFGLMDPVEMHKFLSTGFTGIFYNGLGKLIDFGCDFFNAKDKWAFVKEKLGNVKEAIKEGFGRLGEWFSETWSNAKAWVSDAVSSLWESTKTGLLNLGTWFSEAWTNAKTWVAETASSMWEGIKNCFSNIGGWFSEKASESWNFLKENNPITLLMNGFSSMGEWISGKASDIWNSLKETSFFKILETGFGRIGEYFTERLDMITNFIKENNPFKWISDGFDAVKKWFEEKYQNISATLEEYNPLKPIFGLFEKIKGFFASLSPSAIARSILPEWMIKYLPLDETPAPEPRKFAEGGIVNPSKDGQLAIVGEGGEKEAIMPMSKLASLVLESFKLLKPSEDTHHGDNKGSIFSRMLNSFRSDKKSQKVEDYLFSIDETTKSMQKDIESIYKMVRFIKVDGVTLGDMLDHPVDSKLQTPGGILQAGARAGADSAQYAAALANPQGYAGDSPSGNAAPFAGGKRAPGIGGRYGAIAGKRDELVLAKSQRALNAKGNHMDWSQATNNPGNVGNTDQGGTYIFPDLQSGLKAQRDLLKEKYTKDKQGNRLTLTQMCQKYTPTCWRTALPTWSKYSGIGVNEVPDLDNPQVMAKLMKAIHIAEGSASWVSHDEVDYALGLKQMPQGYQKKDYRQLTEKGKALLAQGSPQEQTMNPAPSPSTPPSAGIPPAPPSGGETQPVANPGGTSTPPSGGETMPVSNPTMNPVQSGGNPSSVINFGGGAEKSFNALNPTFRSRLLGAATEYFQRTGKKISISGPRCCRRTINEQKELADEINKKKDPKVVAAKATETAMHIRGIAADISSTDATKMEQLGILDKYKLTRPLLKYKGIEPWHVEPKEARHGIKYSDKSEIIAALGYSPEYLGRYGGDRSGSGDLVMQGGGNPAPSVPGLAQSNPVQNTPPMAAQNTPPIANMPPAGAGPAPTMQPAAPAPSAPPSMGMGAGGGQPSYGGGNLASRLLGIAKKNADISGVHGYSQEHREDTNKFDCSSFVGRSLQEAGYNVGSISNFTTATMDGILGNLGFQWHKGLDGVQPGDIVCGNGHTEIAIGGGKTIGALNSTKGVGIHPISWHSYTGYWRDGNIAQMSPEEQAAAQASMNGGPVPGIPGQGGNIQGAMQGVQQPDMGQLGGQTAGPQIQGSPQAQAQQAATAYYESGGGGGGNVYAPTTNVMGGGGNADKGGATFLTTKDPMSWIILQGNTVH